MQKNKETGLTMEKITDSFHETSKRCEMCAEIDRLASRHIAKLLTKLGSTIPPVVEQEIKRQFRFFSSDVISVIQGEQHQQKDQDAIGNR